MKTFTDYIRRWSPVAVAAALIVCNGCSDDFGKDMGSGYETYPTDCIVFTTHLGTERGTSGTRSTSGRLEIVEEEWPLDLMPEDSAATRGALTAYLGGEAGVFAFQYDDESNQTPIATDNNLEFTFDGDMLVSKGSSIPWKTIDKTHLNVYAYAPYVQTGTTGSMTLVTTAPPVIDYTVPAAISAQKDILVARWKSEEHTEPGSQDSYKNKTIPLVFDHALTAIRFRVGFACEVKSVEIKGVHNSGRYNFGSNQWEDVKTDQSVATEYKLAFSNETEKFVHFDENAPLEHDNGYMILMPQTLPENAEIILTCKNETGGTGETTKDNVYKAKIGGKVWEPGKLITYTFYEDRAPEMIYFDLALDDVRISKDANGVGKYSGKVYKGGQEVVVSGEHESGNHYYVYQSTEANKAGIWVDDKCTPPTYPEIRLPDGRTWKEFITNNPDADEVINNWCADSKIGGSDVLAKNIGRSGTKNRIEILGDVTCNLTIDNIYSTYQYSGAPDLRTDAGITYKPIYYNTSTTNAKVTVNMVGDNRIGAVHYYNRYDNGNEIIFEGTGSLTVADVDGTRKVDGVASQDNAIGITEGSGYYGNHWSSAIGGNDQGEEQSYGIVINSGILFAGTTKAENCTAIGGGGNVYGKVTINGGTVTAVATTTGTAIGGGIGFNGEGGEGHVTINGGNVYAYNHANKWNIPSSAIGGAGSRASKGNTGTVIITGGYVYAESGLGTAIGGGSSYLVGGGTANITISGGEVFAKTKRKGSASIGGGTAYTVGLSEDGISTGSSSGYNGGNATISIYGKPIIRTGSIGGGGTGDLKGKLGNAEISISGGDIQGQFILQAGTTGTPSFTMSGGTIRNSNTADNEYLHVKQDGGAVWLQNGKVTITGGTIENCKATRGGAIYIAGAEGSTAIFTMSGGTIQNNEAARVNNTGIQGDSDTDDSVDDFAGSGGAIYLTDGEVELTEGTIAGNLAAGGHGGGIFIRRGNLTVDGAEIIGNATEVRKTKAGTYAGGNGGGVYIYSQTTNVNVNLKSGKITGNTSDRRGGGLCVIQERKGGQEEKEATITIGTDGGSIDGLKISGNHSLLQGGGLYARGANANITINSGTIQGNTVSQYVRNQNVANDQGSVTLNGGDENVDVTHNVVTFNANYGTNPQTSTQKIVTETNSRLNAPAFTRMGYTLKGWNSKPSGSGFWYSDNQIMNINKDITLYAQWEFGGS